MEPPPPNNRIKVDNLETYVHLLLCTSLNVNASIEAHNQTNRVNFDDRIFCRFCLNEKKNSNWSTNKIQFSNRPTYPSEVRRFNNILELPLTAWCRSPVLLLALNDADTGTFSTGIKISTEEVSLAALAISKTVLSFDRIYCKTVCVTRIDRKMNQWFSRRILSCSLYSLPDGWPWLNWLNLALESVCATSKMVKRMVVAENWPVLVKLV